MTQGEREALWLVAHPEVELRFAGEWILIEDEQVIAHSGDLGAVLKTAESHPEALLARAHGEEALAL